MKFNTSFITRIRSRYENRSEPENVRSLAVVYWEVITRIGALLVIAACLFGALFLSWSLSEGNDTQSAPVVSAPASSVNRALIERTLSQYAARKILFDEIMGGVGQESTTTPPAR